MILVVIIIHSWHICFKSFKRNLAGDSIDYYYGRDVNGINWNLRKDSFRSKMTVITVDEFIELSKEINSLPKCFCVKNDDSQLFKDTVIKFMNENSVIKLHGDSPNDYYGRDANGFRMFYKEYGMADVTVLTIDEFIKLTKPIKSQSALPEYFCVKNDGTQLFRDTVVSFLNKGSKDSKGILNGREVGLYYGRGRNGVKVYSKASDFLGDVVTLTLDEFIEMTTEVDEEFVLPKNWHVVVTAENQKVLSDWRFEGRGHKLRIGNIAGCSRSNPKVRGHNDGDGIIGDNYNFGTEITFDQFKQYVLNIKPIKEIKNMKKLTGYKLIKPSYEQAARNIVKCTNQQYDFCKHMQKFSDGTFIDRLQEAGVLALWFEPIYGEIYEAGDWVFITGKHINDVCKSGNGLSTNGKDDGAFQLLEIDESKNPTGNYRNKSDFMFKFDGLYFRTNKNNILRRATDDEIMAAKHSKLLAKIKSLYPVGTKFYPAHVSEDGSFCIVANTNFKISTKNGDEINNIYALTDEDRECDKHSKYGNCSLQRVVYSEGKFANIDNAPVIKINGYDAKFDCDEVRFGCQVYDKDFIKKLNKCLQKNNIKMDYKDDVKAMAEYFDKKSGLQA
jgi:hypothetical protein